jgi:hypothetical protein
MWLTHTVSRADFGQSHGLVHFMLMRVMKSDNKISRYKVEMIKKKNKKDARVLLFLVYCYTLLIK